MITFGQITMPSRQTGVFRLVLSLCTSWGLLAGAASPVWAGDLEDAIAAVEAYHQALADKDSVGARALLAADAIILEGGHAETLDEYLSHHLMADMEFTSQVPGEREVLRYRRRCLPASPGSD